MRSVSVVTNKYHNVNTLRDLTGSYDSLHGTKYNKRMLSRWLSSTLMNDIPLLKKGEPTRKTVLLNTSDCLKQNLQHSILLTGLVNSICILSSPRLSSQNKRMLDMMDLTKNQIGTLGEHNIV